MLSAKKSKPGFKSFASKKVRAVQLSGTDLVDLRTLDSELPLIITPKTEKLVLDAWVADNRDFVEEKLMLHGGVLFRGFDYKDENRFTGFVSDQPYELMSYFEGSTPRKEVASKVYTSTLFPREETIALHNEYSSSMRFPLKVWFFCNRAPVPGTGQTPVASTRKILARMDPEVVDEFRRKGWCLKRNFRHGIGLPWQRAYAIDDRDELEAYLKENHIEFEWVTDEHLRTHQVRSAILSHPVTGDDVWFNHMSFWHAANLRDGVREEMLDQLGHEGLAYHTYYGDGTPIPDEVARHIADCYLQEKIMFDWQEGDLLLADNMLISHGRQPFQGDRDIRVAMGQPYYRPVFEPEGELVGA